MSIGNTSLVIVSGLSGAGKARTAAYLEDSGFDVVSNLPAEMILQWADTAGSRGWRKALVYDIRAGADFTGFLDIVSRLRQSYGCRLLFLEADVRTIICRYKETRRRHPLWGSAGSLEAAIRMETDLLAPVRAAADEILDTSGLSVRELFIRLSQLMKVWDGGQDDVTEVHI